MTNDEYLKELAQRGDGSLQAWFDSEHVESDNGETEQGITQNDADSQSNISENSSDVFSDSREKLEADIHEYVIEIAGATLISDRADEEVVHGWLDRQAAITKRHWMEICGASASANVELSKKITELQDELSKRDKGIKRLKFQRDEARDALDDAMKDVLVYKERADNASAFADSYREELRDAYGFMLDISDSLRAKAAAHER